MNLRLVIDLEKLPDGRWKADVVNLDEEDPAIASTPGAACEIAVHRAVSAFRRNDHTNCNACGAEVFT